MPTVHPTAIVGNECEIAPSAEIGPYCVLSGKVRLDESVRLIASVHLNGPVTIGANTVVYPNTCIGFPPQDVKFKLGMPTPGVVVGRDCLLREGVTLHAASKPDRPTTVGDRCFLMAYSHLGHDAKIGNDVTLVNAVLLAGHVEVGDKATIGGGTAIHQFCKVGRLAFVGGHAAVAMDIPPFCISAERNTLFGINLVGLRRNGVARADITTIRRAFREAFRSNLTRKEMIEVLEGIGRESPMVMEMAQFIRDSKRSIAPASKRTQDDEVESE